MRKRNVLKLLALTLAVPLAGCSGKIECALGDNQEYVIDGVLNDACYTETVKNSVIEFGSALNPHFELTGCRVSDGAYFVCTIHSGANTMASSDWFKNANIEFRFGDMYQHKGSPQNYIYFSGSGFTNPKGSVGIEIALVSSEKETEGDYKGLYKTVVEFFVPTNRFIGYEDTSKELRLYVYGYVWNNSAFVGYMNPDSWAQNPDYYYSFLAVTPTGIYWY